MANYFGSLLLDIPDEAFNWMVDFFSGRSHCTSYREETSELLNISASIIQGSAVWPVSYVINATDLTTVTDGNQMHKYADKYNGRAIAQFRVGWVSLLFHELQIFRL